VLWYCPSTLMKFFVFAVLFSLPSLPAIAQEVQVPFDSAGTIMTIDQNLEKKLDLFPTYPHFLEARLYRETDSSYQLEITSFENSKLLKDRVVKSATSIQAIQEDIAARLGPQKAGQKLDQSSRTKLLIWETLLSFLGYAPAITSAINSNNASVGAGLELVIGGLGYLIPAALTEHAPMNDAEGSLALGGAFLGAAHGVLLDIMLSNGKPGREIGPVATVVSIGETGIGYAIASKNNLTEGSADIIRYGGLFGMMDGIGMAFAVDHSATGSLWSALGLAGSAAGFAVGTAMANHEPYTRGNASAVLTAGIYGAMIPPLIYASALSYNTNTNPSTGLLLSAVAGNIGGIVLSNSLMNGTHYSNGEGTAVILGTTAGFAIGLGFGYLIAGSGNLNFSPWAFTAPIVVGTCAGFAISISSIGKGSGDQSSTGWDFEANPAGLLLGSIVQKRAMNPAFAPSILSASYRL